MCVIGFTLHDGGSILAAVRGLAFWALRQWAFLGAGLENGGVCSGEGGDGGQVNLCAQISGVSRHHVPQRPGLAARLHGARAGVAEVGRVARFQWT